MSIKKLFDKDEQSKGLAAVKLQEAIDRGDVESAGKIESYHKRVSRFIPDIDYNNPENFCHYGSAELYYDSAIKNIYLTYPYDGSSRERDAWEFSASYLDRWMFDNKYPRTTGYAVFAPNRAEYVGYGWGDESDSSAVTYTDATSGHNKPGTTSGHEGKYLEYITITGSLKVDSTVRSIKDFDSKSNIYDISKTRGSNLRYNLTSSGVTVEFWMKKGGDVSTPKEVIFDLRNSVTGTLGNEENTDARFGRLTIEYEKNAPHALLVTVQSGTTGVRSASLGRSLATSSMSTWNHYAVALKNTGSNLLIDLHLNGQLNSRIITGSAIKEVIGATTANHSGTLVATIGALSAPTYNSVSSSAGWGKLSASLDEFRYWKTYRTPKMVGNDWFSQIGGGTNTDDANTDLGVYYKFNEGITEDTALDAVVLDYSGRICNGNWNGYFYSATATDTLSRNTGSAITDSGYLEFNDPIIRSTHPHVTLLLSNMKSTGSAHDTNNTSQLYGGLPNWITDYHDRNSDETLKELVQVVGNYFDELSAQIKNVTKIKDINYTSGSAQPLPFADRLLVSSGFDMHEIFSAATLLEDIGERAEDKNFSDSLQNVKNFIYNNIYNNLNSLYKAKGTEKSIRNFLHCVGLDEDVFKINLYADNTTFSFEENYKPASRRVRTVNFNDKRNNMFDATVYQYKSGSDSISYIPGNQDEFTAMTFETEVFFPYKPRPNDIGYGDTKFQPLSASIFGVHTADESRDELDLLWHSDDAANFQVYAVRDYKDSRNVRFELTGTTPDCVLPAMSSSFFKDVYKNDMWNVAVRIKPPNYPLPDLVLGASSSAHNTDADYTVELYGVNTIYDTVVNEFTVSGTMTRSQAKSFLTSSKRVYVGAHRTNFSGTLLNSTDLRIASTRVWLDYLENEEIITHNIDIENYGVRNLYENKSLKQTSLTGTYVPKIETLALHWTFDTITGSNAAGQFIVQDTTTGSADLRKRYGWLGTNTKYKFHGLADKFKANHTGSVTIEYVPAASTQLPETIGGTDMVQSLSRDDLLFTRDSRPVQYQMSIEKSMYQTISEEMLKMFSTIKDFNNIIGEGVNKYRQEYKDMAKIRQLFFEKYQNTPDLEKYVNYYKWFDSAIVKMIENFVPATARSTNNAGVIVESHVLERSKYWHKFPTLDTKLDDPTSPVKGVGEMLYNWKFGHAPVAANADRDGNTANNCLWWSERADRDGRILSSDNANVDSNREGIRRIKITEVSGSTYALRSFARPYRFSGERDDVIEGGSNTHPTKRFGLHRGLLGFNSSNSYIKFLPNKSAEQNQEFISQKACNDDYTPRELDKTKPQFTAKTFAGAGAHEEGSYYDTKGEHILPFTVVTSSVNTGYAGVFHANAQVDFANLHEDRYPIFEGSPMQGPFAERYVGGLQYRHHPINEQMGRHAPSSGEYIQRALDSNSSRPEGWLLQTPTTTGLITAQVLSQSFAASQGPAESTLPYGWGNVGTTATSPAGWQTRTGSTPSAGTGPASGSHGGHYIYAETSPPNMTSSFGLRTPLIDGSEIWQDFSASFYYHMHGSDVGSMRVQVSEDKSFTRGVNNIRVFWNNISSSIVIAGQQQPLSTDPFKKAIIPLNKYVGRQFYLRFLYESSDGPNGDVALDDILIDGKKIESFKLFDATSPTGSALGKDRPTAKLYRDETAKRPLNIRNIKTVPRPTGSLSGSTIVGNYEHNYQVVMATGRDVNNLWLRDPDNQAAIRAQTNASGFTGSHPENPFLNPTPLTNFKAITTGSMPQLGRLTEEQLIEHSASTNFHLPNRETLADATSEYESVRNKSVIVERFSAPGGKEVMSRGYLDPASEMYSVYNTMNYRNLKVRLNHRQDLADHTVFGGWNFKMPDGLAFLPTASIHKTYRNRSLRLTSSAGGRAMVDALTASVFDNAFVTRPIPQSDRQYAWISGSLASGNIPDIAPLGYASYDGKTGFRHLYDSRGNLIGTPDFPDAFRFQTASHVGIQLSVGAWVYSEAPGTTDGTGLITIPVDFAGLNTVVFEPITASNNTLGYAPSADPVSYVVHNGNTVSGRGFAADFSGPAGGRAPKAAILNGILSNRGSIYGWTPFKQIRGDQHPVVREQRRNNVISVITSSIPTALSPAHIGATTQDLVFFTEPPVEVNKPMMIELIADDPSAPGGVKDVTIVTTYQNNTTAFANKKLNTILGTGNKTNDLYKTITSLYLDPDIKSDASPLAGFKSLTYSEVVFPRKEFSSQEESRVRTKYDCKFWRNDRLKRSRIYSKHGEAIPNSKLNSMGIPIPSQSIWPLDARWSFDVAGPGSSSLEALTSSAAVERNTVYHLLSGASGELMNEHSLYHHGHGAGYITASCVFARPRSSSANHIFGLSKWEANAPASKGGSGKNPFFNSYADYAEKLRVKSQGFGLIPEFRMSEHIPTIVDQNAGNFLAEIPGFLELTGGHIANSSADNKAEQESFYKIFSTSDFLKHFEAVQEDHKDIAAPTRVTLKCRAKIGFHPYDGFYPVNRTLQLASLFSSSYFSNFNWLHEGGTAANGAWSDRVAFRPVLTPLFSPGILYNSIKAGLAVDYPIHATEGPAAATPDTFPTLQLKASGSDTSTDEDTPVLSTAFTARLPFETLLEPESHYQKAISGGVIHDSEVGYFQALDVSASYAGGNSSETYKMAMHNFLAESVDFFLENGELTSFVSLPDGHGDFGNVEPGIDKYVMDVVVSNATMINLQKVGTFNTDDPRLAPFGATVQHGVDQLDVEGIGLYEINKGQYFGPSCAVALPGNNTARTEYRLPYTPPYWAGDSVIRYEFQVPEGASKVTLEQIRENLTVGHWNAGLTAFASTSGSHGYTDRFQAHSASQGGASDAGESRNFGVAHCMHATASVNHLGVADIPVVEYNAITGVPQKVKEQEGDTARAWVIQTKWETPHFNFMNSVPNTAGFLSSSKGFEQLHSVNPRGIWHQYGQPIETILGKKATGDFLYQRYVGSGFTPDGFYPVHKGMTMQIADRIQITGSGASTALAANEGSLAELVGFNSKVQRLGKLRDEKEIKEAVVAIPFTRTVEGGFQFYTFPKNWVEYSLGNTDAIGGDKFVPSKGIIDMVNKMQEYVIPPRFNFIQYPDKRLPFVMYIFEFKKNLNKKDIGDIWQNLPPDSLRSNTSIQEAEVEITHTMLGNDFYGINHQDKFHGGIDPKTQWLVFKVKQKAKVNYFKKTLDSKDDDNFQFDFKSQKGDSATKITELPYSYNWPYDYFTMLELVQLEAEVKFSPGTTPPAGLDAEGFEGQLISGEDGDPDPSSNGNLSTNPMSDAHGSPVPPPNNNAGGPAAGAGGPGGAAGLPGAGGGPGGFNIP